MSLLGELKKFRKTEKISMHIPGHKNGRGLGLSFVKNAFKVDVTELDGTDNLQNPSGILASAQEFYSKLYGSAQTYFLTGGSSLGLRASVLGIAKAGDKIIVDRLCHKSVISAITLSGIKPIFISPEFDFAKGLYMGISPEKLSCLIAENPDVVGAIITSPTYYGICSDIEAITKVLHSYGKLLIVDEAHGAHFNFSRKLPPTAISLGADISVQSVHKTLTALGQCSLLHIGKNCPCRHRIERTLRMIQSTSPSYLLMTSIDEAVRHMNSVGNIKLNKLIRMIDNIKKTVCEKTELTFIESKSFDKTRIVVDFSAVEISGGFAEKILIDEFGIYPEMSDGRYVVLIPSVANTKSELKHLCDALISIGTRRFKGEASISNKPLPDVDLCITPFDANNSEFETAPLENAIGRISAQIVSACPPGAAILIPGQKIKAEAVEFIREKNVTHFVDVIKE